MTPLPGPTCPICHKPLASEGQSARMRPFCSQRCADVDLGRWFTGQYRVPGPPPEFDEEAPDPA